jgi:hypothetical protein
MIGLSSAWYPSILNGLEVAVAPGQLLIGGTAIRTPYTIIFLEPNETSYVTLPLSSGTFSVNNSGYPSGELPICTVVGDFQKIISLMDDRPDFSDTGSGGGSTPNFSDAETPSGAINGVNTTFTLLNAPSPAASLKLTQNGLILEQGTDYTLSAQTLTFLNPPLGGDLLSAWYRY